MSKRKPARKPPGVARAAQRQSAPARTSAALPAHGTPPALVSAAAVKAQPDPADSRLKKAWKWVTARWWHAVAAACCAILVPAAAVIGTSLGKGAEHVAHSITGGPKPAAESPRSGVTPLGVQAIVTYSDAISIGLATPVTTGIGYADLVAGPTDNAGDPDTWGSFLAQHYGAPVKELHVDLDLTSQVNGIVRVTNIQIERVGHPAAPLSGTYIPIPHAGTLPAYFFSANMDAANPVLQRLSGGQTFPDVNIMVSQADQDTLAINFFATRYSSRWILVITYEVGSKDRYLDVRAPNNQPFAITGQARSYKATYASNFPAAGYYLQRRTTAPSRR